MIDRLAWVTTRTVRGSDEDEPLGLAALARTGTAVDVVDWDDPDVRWADYDRVLLRSAWDYPERLPEFLRWIDAVAEATTLINPPATVRWNLDKRYLAELAAAGVPTIPTDFVAPGSAVDLPAGNFVVKPAVGAGSRDAAWYADDEHDAARAHLDRLHRDGRTVLVQPMITSVATDGEWPLVFFGGEYSHAAAKRVQLPRAGTVDDLYAHETNAAHTASADQIAVARSAVDVVARQLGTPTYARVDLVRDDSGGYCVLEVELVEPSLFLPWADGSADRLAAAVVRA
jgi:glutathione synthase/RimK-type ligase-like ATP-grasp enzyme